MPSRNATRILIVGVNFAGLATAVQLPERYRVRALDRSGNFEYLPNIHELVSGVKSPANLRLPRHRLLRRAGHRFVQEAVVELDAAAGTALVASGRRIEFDLCVVAVGGVNDFFGVQGAARFGLPFKSVADCAAIGERLKLLVARQDDVSVVIVGGGLEGVECLGEILRRYRRRGGLEVHVVDRAERLLPGEPAALDREIRRICKALPVRFHTGIGVSAVAEREVRLTSGEAVPADLTIWTGGARAAESLVAWGLAEGGGEWAPVRDTLQSTFFDNVFLAGDAAGLAKQTSKQAYYAIQMGESVAGNLQRIAEGRKALAFRPSRRPTLIAFGDLTTFLVFGGTVVAGPALSAAKEAVFQATMARFDPPVGMDSFSTLQDRWWSGFAELALPTLLSPATFLRLGDVQLLDC